MSIFDVNYQSYALNNMPPPKRKSGILGWLYSLIYPLQWRHDINYGSYWTGSTDPGYSLSATYTKGQRVIFYLQGGGAYCGDNAVYEANINVPINTPPISANQVNASGVGYWIPVQANFIGVNERVTWSCQQLTMEIALNRWFNVPSFSKQQWDHTGPPPYTQIYIDTNQLEPGEEYWAPFPFSYWAPSSLQSLTYHPPVPESATEYDFTIYVPAAIFNNLVYPATAFSAGHTENNKTNAPPQATDVTRNGSIIRALVDKFNAIGMIYNITLY